jgi:CHAT domain-containing protein
MKVRLDAARLDQLYLNLDRARVEYEAFQNSLYAAHPEINIKLGRTSPLTVEELSAFAKNPKTAYLEFVVTKERIYLFVLIGGSDGRAKVQAYPIAAIPDQLVQKVNQFHDALAEQRLAYATAARELYTLLIGPAEQLLRGVDTICVIPDSFLWNIPFQALMTPSEHFLIEDQALYYAPSLSVLREMNRKKRSTTNASLIAFGNPVVGKDEQRNVDLCPLLEAEQEVSSIAKSFDQKSAKVFIGREATERSFKSLAPTYSIIHLATHGLIDNRQPLYSHLLLTETEGDPENDGRLEARQIMDMNLNAELAVLSACETANGKVAPGEGVIGMSWAFFIAGTRSMFVSEWKVNSTSTSQLMTYFYHALATNTDHPGRNKAHCARGRSARNEGRTLPSPFLLGGLRDDWERFIRGGKVPTGVRYGSAGPIEPRTVQ